MFLEFGRWRPIFENKWVVIGGAAECVGLWGSEHINISSRMYLPLIILDLYLYPYLCICICVFVFVNLHLCICICAFVWDSKAGEGWRPHKYQTLDKSPPDHLCLGWPSQYNCRLLKPPSSGFCQSPLSDPSLWNGLRSTTIECSWV